MSLLTEVVSKYTLSKSPESVRIRDPAHVESLLKTLVEGGRDSLQVITDFDFTLTRYHLNGKRCTSSHGVMDKSPLMPPDFRTKADLNYSKYYTIEIDPGMSIEEKIPYMEEWYTKAHDLLVSFRVERSLIKQMVEMSETLFRDGSKEMLKRLNKVGVPVLVFSAGVGDLLEEVLRREESYLPNVHVVSNYMLFDEEERLCGFKDPLIHMFNKGCSLLKDTDYFTQLSHRHNGLLLGDSLGDIDMIKGADELKNVLKIGFLNDKIEERMDVYTAAYDIVIIDDQSMDLVSLILDSILKESPTN